mmetsp:Transcript_21697/g.71774  ORF Transcript_21697/g.71774 Transcript_21697/m.71774 type:complete len:319 (-) Transcript_21697:1981-2937(-)
MMAQLMHSSTACSALLYRMETGTSDLTRFSSLAVSCSSSFTFSLSPYRRALASFSSAILSSRSSNCLWQVSCTSATLSANFIAFSSNLLAFSLSSLRSAVSLDIFACSPCSFPSFSASSSPFLVAASCSSAKLLRSRKRSALRSSTSLSILAAPSRALWSSARHPSSSSRACCRSQSLSDSSFSSSSILAARLSCSALALSSAAQFLSSWASLDLSSSASSCSWTLSSCDSLAALELFSNSLLLLSTSACISALALADARASFSRCSFSANFALRFSSQTFILSLAVDSSSTMELSSLILQFDFHVSFSSSSIFSRAP